MTMQNQGPNMVSHVGPGKVGLVFFHKISGNCIVSSFLGRWGAGEVLILLDIIEFGPTPI
jgi:hypothetical protein